MENLFEYVVTCKTMEECDSFCQDIESDGGSLTIPNRAVQVYKTRPLSLNTHYMLTHEEADQIRSDPRVLGVELADMVRVSIVPCIEEANINIPPESTGYVQGPVNFHKGSANNSAHFNWGYYRCWNGTQTANWGSDGTSSNTQTVNSTATGKYVDVIVLDGHINPNHFEYAVNQDGTGGSRVIQFNWFTLNSTVSSIDNDTAPLLSAAYVYPTNFNDGNATRTDDNNHGAHVAGTVAGNRQGWARDANIYNISPYSTNANNLDSLILWDYIRAFHRTKAVNATTGRRNPTIVNCSYGQFITFPNTTGYTSGSITKTTTRGVVRTGAPLSSSDLTASKIYNTAGTATVPFFSTSIASDIQQAIDDGIIIVGAAGNTSQLMDITTGLDYNNSFEATYNGTNFLWNQNRGTTPSCASNVICVGAVSALVNESKATYSNCGPRVDVYAPGTNIMSSLNNNVSYGGVTDARGTYIVGKIQGTSMASPQVCGVLASMLEVYPNWTQADALSWLQYWAKTGQMTTTNGGTNDLTDLQGSTNRYLFYKTERQYVGPTYPSPKNDYRIRPSSGHVFPRIKHKFFK